MYNVSKAVCPDVKASLRLTISQIFISKMFQREKKPSARVSYNSRSCFIKWRQPTSVCTFGGGNVWGTNDK